MLAVQRTGDCIGDESRLRHRTTAGSNTNIWHDSFDRIFNGNYTDRPYAIAADGEEQAHPTPGIEFPVSDRDIQQPSFGYEAIKERNHRRSMVRLGLNR